MNLREYVVIVICRLCEEEPATTADGYCEDCRLFLTVAVDAFKARLDPSSSLELISDECGLLRGMES